MSYYYSHGTLFDIPHRESPVRRKQYFHYRSPRAMTDGSLDDHVSYTPSRDVQRSLQSMYMVHGPVQLKTNNLGLRASGEYIHQSTFYSEQKESATQERKEMDEKMKQQQKYRKRRYRYRQFSDLQEIDEENNGGEDSLGAKESKELQKDKKPAAGTEKVEADPYQKMAVHELLDQCQEHFSVINTCSILQQIVSDELRKQGKMDDAICQKLTSKAQRLQQTMFLEKVQSPEWVRNVLEELRNCIIHRAKLYKEHASSLADWCKDIQLSLEKHHEVMNTVTHNQEPKPASNSKEPVKDEGKEKTVPELDKPEKPEENNAKVHDLSFLQTGNAFEGIRKTWMKLLSLLEYQQEQYDTTLERISQVEAEIKMLTQNEDSDSLQWRKNLQKNDLETKKELLEARKQTLEKDLNGAKNDLQNFEAGNKQDILEILNTLCQFRSRYDTSLRQNFHLLTSVCLHDPACLQHHKDINNANDKPEWDQCCRPMTNFLHDSESLTNTASDEVDTSKALADKNNCENLISTSSNERIKNETLRHYIKNPVSKNTNKVKNKSPKSDQKRNKSKGHDASYTEIIHPEPDNISGNKPTKSDVHLNVFVQEQPIGTFQTPSCKSTPKIHFSVKSPELTSEKIIFKEETSSKHSSHVCKDTGSSYWNTNIHTEQKMQKHLNSVNEFKGYEGATGRSNEDNVSAYVYQACSMNVCERENCLSKAYNSVQHKFLHENRDTIYKDRSPFEGNSMQDIFLRKENRLSYFLSKYTNRAPNVITYLPDYQNVPRSTAWGSSLNDKAKSQQN